MLETMDSFRRQLMGIASPQNSMMSLASTVGGGDGSAHGGYSYQQQQQQQYMNTRNSSSESRTNPADIVVPPREMNAASDDYQFRAEPRQDAIDDLLSVGGLSKLSLMSGVSEATLDANGVNRRDMVHSGSSELTLDSTLRRPSLSSGSGSGGGGGGSSNRGRMTGQNMGFSTRSAAMSEVSALDFLQEEEIEDDL